MVTRNGKATATVQPHSDKAGALQSAASGEAPKGLAAGAKHAPGSQQLTKAARALAASHERDPREKADERLHDQDADASHPRLAMAAKADDAYGAALQSAPEAGGDAATQDGAAAQGASSTDAGNTDDSQGPSTALILGGVLLGGGAIAAIASGGGSNKGPATPPPAANSAPRANATQAVTTTEDNAVTGSVGATDADSDTLTYTVSAPARGTAQVTATGAFTYTPSANFNGTDTFNVTVSDGKGGTVTQAVTVTISPVNDVPTFASGTASVTTAEDTATVFTPAASDVDGDPLSYSVSAVTRGTAAVGADGKITFTPDANYNGQASFVVTANDGKGGTVNQTVNVTVTAVNDGPVFASATASATTAEDTPVTFRPSAADVEGDAITYTINNATRGTATVAANGIVTFTPEANYNGPASFVVTASDGNGGTASQTVNVAVTPLNDAPQFGAASLTLETTEDRPVSFLPAATDVDGDTLTYTLGAVTNGTATVGADGRITFTPAAEYSGPASFVVTAADSRGGTATQTVNVAVAAANDAPQFGAANVALSTAEDTPVTFTPAATDIEGDSLTYTVSSITNGTATVAADGQITFTPAANYSGNGSFLVTATDPSGATATQTVTVAVSPGNDPPSFAQASVTASTNEDQSFTYTPVAIDPDAGDTLVYTVANALNGTASVTNGVVTFTPNANYAGNASFVVTATDAAGLQATQTVNLTVVNQPDLINLDTIDQVANGGDDNPLTARALDADNVDAVYSDSADLVSNTVIANFGTDDLIRVDQPAENYNFTANATDLFITYQTPDGVVNEIQLAGAVQNGNVLVFNEATAEQALGFDFFQTSAPPQPAVTISLDVDSDANANTQEVLSGASAQATFTENANQPDYVRVDNFGLDDMIVVSNANASDFNFSADADNIYISYQTSSGVVNDITLTNVVVDGSVLVFDEATAEIAAGHNFFSATGGGSGQPNVPPAAGSLDVDSDGNANTQTVLDAGTNAFSFTENAAAANYVAVQNFAGDDSILVSNAAQGDFNFTADANNIYISYQTPNGVANDITLVGAVSDQSVLVFDEVTAELAVGHDFFTYA